MCATKPQDAEYSDEEFGSGHEYEDGYEEFADENAVVDEIQYVIKQGSPVEIDEEDADKYAGEFDEDDPTIIRESPPPAGTGETPIERTPTEALLKDAEPYDDEGSYGEDSHAGSESEHENDEARPERPQSGFHSTICVTRSAVHDDAVDDHPTALAGDFTYKTRVLLNVSTPDEQSPPKESNAPDTESPENNNCDDDYADEMQNEFPSDSNTPHFEREGTSHKSSEDASDYDADEFLDDGRRETEILLQEARTLLEQQQNESEIRRQSSTEQIIKPPDTIMRTTGNTADEDPRQTKTNETRNERSGSEK